MRYTGIVLLLVLILLASCIPRTPPAVDVLEADVTPTSELEPPRLAVFLQASPETAASMVVSFFLERGLLGFFWREPSALRVRSSWTEEPEGEHRLRRISYATKILPYSSPTRIDCTSIEIRWAVESRAYTDYNWTIDKVGDSYEPLLFKDLRDLFAGRYCPPE